MQKTQCSLTVVKKKEIINVLESKYFTFYFLSTKIALILHDHYNKFKLRCVQSFRRCPPSEIFHFLKKESKSARYRSPWKSKTQHDINILFRIHWCPTLFWASFSSFSTKVPYILLMISPLRKLKNFNENKRGEFVKPFLYFLWNWGIKWNIEFFNKQCRSKSKNIWTVKIKIMVSMNSPHLGIKWKHSY